nr:YciI family protein [Trebonia sp.]
MRERAATARAVIEEMTAAGVFVFSDGGLDASTVVCSVDPGSGSPVFTDGPFAETGEHLSGFAVVDVRGDAEARYWAGRIAAAVGWPQEVHRFPHRIAQTLDTPSEAAQRTPQTSLAWVFGGGRWRV